jgi:hypothetical protein
VEEEHWIIEGVYKPGRSKNEKRRKEGYDTRVTAALLRDQLEGDSNGFNHQSTVIWCNSLLAFDKHHE